MKFREIVTGVSVINVKYSTFNIKFQLFSCLWGHERRHLKQIKKTLSDVLFFLIINCIVQSDESRTLEIDNDMNLRLSCHVFASKSRDQRNCLAYETLFQVCWTDTE